MASKRQEVNRILYVKNLNYKTKGEDLWELFGRYGPVRQIRLGTTNQTRGTAYVVMEEVGDARRVYENLNGYYMHERYLVVLYHQNQIIQSKIQTREAQAADFARASAATT